MAGLFVRDHGTHGKLTELEFIEHYMNLNFLLQNDRTKFISTCLNDWGLTRSDYDKANLRSVTTIVKPTSPIHISASCDTVDQPRNQTNVKMKENKVAADALESLIPANKKGTTNPRNDDMGMTRRGHDLYTQKLQRGDQPTHPLPTRPKLFNWPFTHPSVAEGLEEKLQPTIALQSFMEAPESFKVSKDTKPMPAPLRVVASELQKETTSTAGVMIGNNMDKFDALARLALADKAAAHNPRDGRNLNVSIHCKSLHGYVSGKMAPNPPSEGSPRKRGMITNSSASDQRFSEGSGNSRDNTDGSGGYSSSDCSPVHSANITRSTSPNTVTKDHSTNESTTTGGVDNTISSSQFMKNSSAHGPPRISASRHRPDYGHYTNIEITDYELDRSISGNQDEDELDRSVSGHAVTIEVSGLMHRVPSSSQGLGNSRHGLGNSKHGLGNSKHGALHTSFADQAQFSDQASSALPSIHPNIVAIPPTSDTVPILKRQSSSRNAIDYLNSFNPTATITQSQSQQPSPQQSSSPSKKSGEQLISISQRDVEAIMKRLADLEYTVSTLQKHVKDQQVHIHPSQISPRPFNHPSQISPRPFNHPSQFSPRPFNHPSQI